MNIPISNWQDYEEFMLHKKKCPECQAELEEVGQQNGPDDFDITGLRCRNIKCDYEFSY